MSSTPLDMPLTPSAEQIRRREFVSKRRGYDPDQVRAYLRQIGDQVESLEGQLLALKAEAAAVTQTQAQADAEAATAAQRSRDDAYSQLSERMVDLLRTAERHADEIRREGEVEASRMIAEARAEADRIGLDAQAKAEATRQEAEDLLRGSRNRVDQAVIQFNARRGALAMELDDMRERMLAMVQSIDDIERDALERPQAIETNPERSGEVPVLRIPDSPSSDQLAAAQPGIRNQYAEIWGDDKPTSQTSEPTLEDVDPEEPPF